MTFKFNNSNANIINSNYITTYANNTIVNTAPRFRVNFNSEDTITNLPNFTGEDITQLNDIARLNSLYQVGV